MDGLSGAASVAGILSITVQLAESIQKLSASEDIEDIVDDLEVLTYVLAEIQRCEELFGPQHATAKAILRCRRQVQALENMVAGWKEDLEQGNRWRRGQAAAKVVIKTEKVKEWRGKISEAKETLSLALQASSRFVTSHP
ncbi:hypothetical protein SLS58_005575 [Diplodia intermedia]|uniref:Fungal N-terminal domain-containing protein n=1 Tax=Diplodia intermedia TaxID=856260 RepID=A0ABR3TQU7_9PEZI